MQKQKMMTMKKSAGGTQINQQLMMKRVRIVGEWREQGMPELCSYMEEWRIKEALFCTSPITRPELCRLAPRHPRD